MSHLYGHLYLILVLTTYVAFACFRSGKGEEKESSRFDKIVQAVKQGAYEKIPGLQKAKDYFTGKKAEKHKGVQEKSKSKEDSVLTENDDLSKNRLAKEQSEETEQRVPSKQGEQKQNENLKGGEDGAKITVQKTNGEIVDVKLHNTQRANDKKYKEGLKELADLI